jgi:two-component system chemotaxis response regulator CheY
MPRASLPAAGLRQAIVVDDSRAMRAMLRHVLEHEGFEVTEAADGSQALNQLTTGEVPLLALIDWNMPRLDGLSLIRTLRSSPRFAELTIVMVTSEADPTHVEQALEAGADEYIMKPLSAEVLREKLALLEQP